MMIFLTQIPLSLKSKIIRTKPRNAWYTQALNNLNLLNVILNVSGLVLIPLKISTESNQKNMCIFSCECPFKYLRSATNH